MGWRLDTGSTTRHVRKWDFADEDVAPALQAPDSPLVRAIYGALMASPSSATGAWRATGTSLANVQRIGPHCVRIVLESGELSLAWRELAAITPASLDVLTLLLSRPAHLGEWTARLVKATDVLEAKGIRRWGGERRALVGQVCADLNRLRRLSAGPTQQLLFDLEPVGETDFVHRPAAWLRAAWEEGRWRQIAPELLAFDHRATRGADVLAKKLGLYLTFATPEAGSSVRTVQSLLKATGLGGADLASRAGRGGRLVDRFEEARLRLQEAGLFSTRYRGLADDDILLEPRVKGFVKRWLASELVIERRPSLSAGGFWREEGAS